jgi:hypothetical protein
MIEGAVFEHEDNDMLDSIVLWHGCLATLVRRSRNSSMLLAKCLFNPLMNAGGVFVDSIAH